MPTFDGDVVNRGYRDAKRVRQLSLQFATGGYVKLPNLLTGDAQATLAQEVGRLSTDLVARDFVMPGLATPRRMKGMGGKALKGASAPLMAFYQHPDIEGLLSDVAGEPAKPCGHANEFMVMNVFDQAGATHGWHFDDPALALVVIIDAPPAADGGLVEFVSDCLKAEQRREIARLGGIDAFVADAQNRGLLRRRHHQPGDAYMLRADRCLHRVTPVAEGGFRAILNLAFELGADTQYGDSADILYDFTERARAA